MNSSKHVKNKEYTIVNFTNFCDSALEYFTEALKSIVRLVENERIPHNSNGISYAKGEAEQKCINAIYSCMTPKDRELHGIADFDVIEFLKNTGVICGDYYNAKKSHKKKIEDFKLQIESCRNGVDDPITHFLIILEALEATGCITVDRKIGSIKRTEFKSESKMRDPFVEKTSQKSRERTLPYTECNDNEESVSEEINLNGYKGSPTNPYFGGSFSSK